MDLYREILAKALAKEILQGTFLNPQPGAKEIVELACYQALAEIKEILADDSLQDAECFRQIEEIIHVFEALGSSGKSRHDFG